MAVNLRSALVDRNCVRSRDMFVGTTRPIRHQARVCQPAPKRCRYQTLPASQADDRGAMQQERIKDPFVAASLRLERLINGAGDGEEELLRSIVEQEGPDFKLKVNAVLGSLTMTGSLVICWLCHNDPWGGASFSMHSLSAAALGLLAAAPMVAFKQWTWSRHAYSLFPVLKDLHAAEVRVAAPWLSGLSTSQVAVLLCTEILPALFLLLPAAQGGLSLSLLMYSSVLENCLGVTITPEASAVAALLITAGLASLAAGGEVGVTDEEYEILQTAISNADRYYRVMAMDVNSRVQDAHRAARAFKNVAQVWLESRQDISKAAAVIASLRVVYLGALWHVTDDLTAPAVVALLAAAVDYHQLHKMVSRPGNHAKGISS